MVRTAGQRVVAATLYDGIVVEPKAVERRPARSDSERGAGT